MATAPDSVRRAQPLLGTFVEITVSHAPSPDTETAIEEAFGAAARVHRLMSFHDPASDVSRLNREAADGPVIVDAWTFQVLEIAVDLHRRSDGVFDIAVAPVLQSRGLLPFPEPDQRPNLASTRIDDPVELLAGRRVRFRQLGVRIDLGGIAKGFAVDRACDALRRRGVPQGLVNAGGDLAAFGPEPQMVHIRNPSDPRRLLCATAVVNSALASTGGCVDLFRSSDIASSAVVDPFAQQQIGEKVGATVLAPSCVIADALTKVVMIQGQDAAPLLDHYRASALLVSADGNVCVTSNWQNSLAA
jgi:FAD:protein FMN transferase